MLCGFGFEFFACAEVGYECEVDEHGEVSEFPFELSDGLDVG